jgi:transcriptional regulator with XRE-family HTH domain
MVLDITQLDVELARRRLTRTDLARRIGKPPTTLSGWLRGHHPGPPNLPQRLEEALELEPGTLERSVDDLT